MVFWLILFVHVCIFFIIGFSGSFFVKRSNCDFIMQMVSFLWTGQANRKKYSSKSHFSLCYASACETNTRMMQKNIKEKKYKTKPKNSLIIIHFAFQ